MSEQDKRVSYAAHAARVFALIALVFVPISTALTNFATILFMVAALLSPEVWRNWRQLYRHPVALAALLLMAMLAISVTYTVAPLNEALSWLLKYRKLLLIPLLILVFSGANWNGAIRYGLIGSLLFVMILSSSNYLGWTSVGALHNATDPVTRAWVFKNHITAGIFSALLFSVCMDQASSAAGRRTQVFFYALAAWSLVNVFIMLQGRTGQVIAIFFCVYHAMRLAWAHRGHTPATRVRRLVLFAVPCVLLIGASLHMKADRLTEIDTEYSDYLHDNAVTSVGLRAEWYQRSLEIFAEKPLFGHGEGSVQYEFAPLTQGLTGARGTGTANPHNQYLLIAVELGLVGVGLLLNLLVQIARSGRALPPTSRHLLYAYLFAFSLGSLVNSLLLDFSEGYMFVLLTGILLGCACRQTTAAGATQRQNVELRWKTYKAERQSSNLP